MSFLALAAGYAMAQEKGGAQPAPRLAVPQPAAPQPPASPLAVPGPPVTVPEGMLPPPVLANQRLTLVDALSEGLQHNPLLIAATRTVSSTHESLLAARRPLDPQIGMGFGFSSTTSVFNFVSLEDFTLTGVMETSGRHRLRVRSAEEVFRGSRYDRETARLNSTQSVTNAYVSLQLANRSLEAQTELYRIVAQQLALTQRQLELGAAREIDVDLLRIALAQAEQALIQARANAATARANLNMPLGREADAPVDAAELLHFTPVRMNPEALKALALENRPEIASEQATIANLRVAVRQARSQYYPDVTLTGRPIGVINPSEIDLFFSGSLQFPLPLGTIKHQVRKAQYDVSAEEARLANLHNQVTLDVQTAWLNLEQARRIVDTYETGRIVALSREVVERTRRGFQLGGSTVLEVLTAETSYRTSLLSYYQAIANHQQALAALERAIGKPLAGPEGEEK
jgi:outer membrane protein TolC